MENVTLVCARNVKRLMDGRGWTLVELAKHSGVSKSAISNLVNYTDRGDNHPSTKTLELLAGAFGKPTWELLMPDGHAAAGMPPLDPEKVRAVHEMVREYFKRRGQRYDIEQMPEAFVDAYRIGGRIPEEMTAAEWIELGTKLAQLPVPIRGSRDAERSVEMPPARGTGSGMGKGNAGKAKAARSR